MTLMRQNDFGKAVHALDRLNSWVRSPGDWLRSPMGTFKPMIYWVKTKAILSASKRMEVRMRRIVTPRKCKSCGGTGKFRGWWWMGEENDYKPCNRCDNGTANLRFVETEFEGIRWHTPAEEWAQNSLDVYVPYPVYHPQTFLWLPFDLETKWQPETPGRPMELAEVERDLRLVRQQFREEMDFILHYHFRLGHRKMGVGLNDFNDFVKRNLYQN